MCGRYTLETGEDFQEFMNIVKEVEHNLAPGTPPVAFGEIYPTNFAPVLTPMNQVAAPMMAVWGFPQFQRSGVIINARAETAAVKPLFRQSLLQSRCIIPSTGFFEWDKRTKQKYRFNLPDTGLLYMAGLVRVFDGQSRFVVLTTAANESMQDIHDRMPVVLKKGELHDWLCEPHSTDAFLHRIPPELQRREVS